MQYGRNYDWDVYLTPFPSYPIRFHIYYLCSVVGQPQDGDSQNFIKILYKKRKFSLYKNFLYKNDEFGKIVKNIPKKCWYLLERNMFKIIFLMPEQIFLMIFISVIFVPVFLTLF